MLKEKKKITRSTLEYYDKIIICKEVQNQNINPHSRIFRSKNTSFWGKKINK